jgi:hypothetical protein
MHDACDSLIAAMMSSTQSTAPGGGPASAERAEGVTGDTGFAFIAAGTYTIAVSIPPAIKSNVPMISGQLAVITLPLAVSGSLTRQRHQ